MRVRYKLPNEDGIRTDCDLSVKEAKHLFNELKAKPLVIWGELVSEDEDSYMDIIDSFEHNVKTSYMLSDLGVKL